VVSLKFGLFLSISNAQIHPEKMLTTICTITVCLTVTHNFIFTDIRTKGLMKGKSLNLALSLRGQDALKAVDISEAVDAVGIPMYGRMIHDLGGKRRPIPYGRSDQVS
jgi:hypothetical protein